MMQPPPPRHPRAQPHETPVPPACRDPGRRPGAGRGPPIRRAPRKSSRASVRCATANRARARARSSRAWPASTRPTWRASWPTTRAAGATARRCSRWWGTGAGRLPALGAYFEKQPTFAHPVADPELAQVGRYIYLRGNADRACRPAPPATAKPARAPRRCRAWPASMRATPRPSSSCSKGASAPTTTPSCTGGVTLTDLEIKAVASYVSGLQ